MGDAATASRAAATTSGAAPTTTGTRRAVADPKREVVRLQRENARVAREARAKVNLPSIASDEELAAAQARAKVGLLPRASEAELAEAIKAKEEAEAIEAMFQRAAQTPLGKFLGTWFRPLKDDLDELGVESLDDLSDLDEEDAKRLASKIKRVPARRFMMRIAGDAHVTGLEDSTDVLDLEAFLRAPQGSPQLLSKSDRSEWLTSLLAHLDVLGVTSVQDLKLLDENDVEQLASKLPKIRAKQFRQKVEALVEARLTARGDTSDDMTEVLGT